MVFIRTIPPEDATGKLKELYDEGYKNTGSYPPRSSGFEHAA